MRVQLAVVESADAGLRGKVFTFSEPDTFLFGRAPDVHCRIPDDSYVSRHHFLLEIAPPALRLRDLDSHNGTYVNKERCGGPVNLKAGDRIQVGKTAFEVSLVLSVVCLLCDAELDGPAAKAALSLGNKVICRACVASKKQEAAALQMKPPLRASCARCGKDVLAEDGSPYLCVSCRSVADLAPALLLADALAQGAAGIQEHFSGQGADAPEILQYEIGTELGRGGMGAVYLARHRRTQEQAAVKIMLPKMASNARSRNVFEREILVTHALSHPNIVRFIGRGSAGGIYYFVLEYAEGGSLEDLLKERGGRLSPKEACPLIAEALSGLAHAHAAGFIHRDLKPGNILLGGPAGARVPKIGDFGLAKSFEKAGLSGMTQAGQFGGTYHYMPREQVTDYRFAKPVSDVFAMGATLYRLLAGEPVYDFRAVKEPFTLILEGRIVPIEKKMPELPPRLAQAVGRSIEPEAAERFQSAAEMREALLRAL